MLNPQTIASALPPNDVTRILQSSGDVLNVEYRFHRVLRDVGRTAVYQAQLLDSQAFVAVKRLTWLKNLGIRTVSKATDAELYPTETDSPFVLKPLSVSLNSHGSVDVISPLCSCDLEAFLAHQVLKAPEPARREFLETTFPLVATIIVQGLGSLAIHDIHYPDMKLSNLFIRLQDEPLPTVGVPPGLYVGDFEHCLKIGRHEKAMVSYGTVGYAPPEMMHEKHTHVNSSVFSIAQTLYQYLLGRFYVRGRVADEIPAMYRDLFQGMLKPDPDDRPVLTDLMYDPRLNIDDPVPKFLLAVANLKHASAPHFPSLFQARSIGPGSPIAGSIDKIRYSPMKPLNPAPTSSSSSSSFHPTSDSVAPWRKGNIAYDSDHEFKQLRDAIMKHYADLLRAQPEDAQSTTSQRLISSLNKPEFVLWFDGLVRDFTQVVWQDMTRLSSKWMRATVACYLICCYGIFKVGKAHFVEEFKQRVLPTLSEELQLRFGKAIRRDDQVALFTRFETFWESNRVKYLESLFV